MTIQPIFTRLCAINDPLPPLGKKVVPPPKPKPLDPVEAFEKLRHEQPAKQAKWLADHGLIEGAAQATNESKTMQSQSQDSAPTKNAPASPNRTSAIPAGDGGPVRQFKVGDKVRYQERMPACRAMYGDMVIQEINGKKIKSMTQRGVLEWSEARSLELIPELGTTPEAPVVGKVYLLRGPSGEHFHKRMNGGWGFGCIYEMEDKPAARAAKETTVATTGAAFTIIREATAEELA